MLKRYLGNKTSLVPDILKAVESCSSPGMHVGDLFAGTMSVSLALKGAGYRVVANDINLFSCVFGKAHIENSEIPEFSIQELIPTAHQKTAISISKSQIEALLGKDGFHFLENRDRKAEYLNLLAVLNYLFEISVVHSPKGKKLTYIFDTYCEEGRRASFESSRGRTGKRRFFSPENAKNIDTILNCVRSWRKQNLISNTAYYVLCSVFVRAVEKVSNTQGTYHDFPREKYDSRALNRITFEPPPFDITLTGGQHIIGGAEDSLQFANKIPQLDVLYLDPPYNFRQYTSYYFMPNLICRYADLDNLDEYFNAIQFVRGQNMEDDFTSTFCKSSVFISSLSDLISRAQSNVVILSYFNGRNHWNKFKSDCNGRGYSEMESFFNGPLFEPSSASVIPIKRLNYQSYGGYKAREIEEYLFVGKRVSTPQRQSA